MTEIDMIERVRRINPVPREPAPLPIAWLRERIEAPPRRRLGWRGSGRGNLLLGGIAAAGAALALLALLASGGGTPNVAEAMYEATAPGSGVLHMNTLTEQIAGGQTKVTREQFWSEQNPRRVRMLTDDGEETLESALTTHPPKLLQWSQSEPGVIKQSMPTGIPDSEQTGVEVLRELYRKGELTLAGKQTFDGQPAWLLEVHPAEARATLDGRPLANPTVVVSASTFVPLEFTDYSVTTESGSPQLLVTKVHYLAYEELPRNAPDEALLQLAEHAGATVQAGG